LRDCLKFPWCIWNFIGEKTTIVIYNYKIIKPRALYLATSSTAKPLTLWVIKPKFSCPIAICACGLIKIMLRNEIAAIRICCDGMSIATLF
jgi:hypothetical protein